MEIINNELRLFVKDITLFLQSHSNYTPEKIEPMFQRAYKLYVKYDVENEQAVEAVMVDTTTAGGRESGGNPTGC